jgi:hypothetical protein
MNKMIYQRTQPAVQTPFDPTGTDLVSTDTESAIKEVLTTVGVSASPGFSWGRSGNVIAGTWLQNDTVPSNKSGRTVALLNPEVTSVFVANEDVSTFTVDVYEHDGNEIGISLLGSSSVTATRSATFLVSYAVTSGRQLAIRIGTGSAKNPVVGLQLKGNVS